MDHDRSLHARFPRPRHGGPDGVAASEADRLVEAARYDRLPLDDADPLVRLLAALREAGAVRGGQGR